MSFPHDGSTRRLISVCHGSRDVREHDLWGTTLVSATGPNWPRGCMPLARWLRRGCHRHGLHPPHASLQLRAWKGAYRGERRGHCEAVVRGLYEDVSETFAHHAGVE